MLERTKRIPFRISSLSSKVEPEPGAGPSYRLRLRNTGWNDLVPWPAWAWSWTWSAWCRRYTWCWQRRRRSSRPRSSCTTWYAASASTSRISFLARSWRNERIRKKDDPYLWTFNIKVTKLPVMNVSFRLNSFLNRFFENNLKANQCWNSHPKRSIFYFLLLLSPYGCGWPCWDLYTKWSLLPHFLYSCKRKCISVEEVGGGGGNAISCIIFGVFSFG